MGDSENSKREGRQAFVAAIAAQHGRRLRRYLAARLRNTADAPDIVQEVYLRLLRVEQHEVIRSPEAYLFTVASHLLYEHSMRQSAQPPVVELEDLGSGPSAVANDDPISQVETQQRIEELEGVITKLSPNAQATLVLHRRDGYSLEEIAGKLGITRNTVKKHLARALLYCRRNLGHQHGETESCRDDTGGGSRQGTGKGRKEQI